MSTAKVTEGLTSLLVVVTAVCPVWYLRDPLACISSCPMMNRLMRECWRVNRVMDGVSAAINTDLGGGESVRAVSCV